MKIILSRKGFDSANGGIVSPIMEDGTLISFPIPSDDKDNFEDLIYRGQSYAKILQDLNYKEHPKYHNCHLDPDLTMDRRKDKIDGWCPIFGQVNSSAVYLLKNVDVEVGDLFLFFGNYHKVRCVDVELKKEVNAMKKVISSVLALITLLFCLVGCDNSKDIVLTDEDIHTDYAGVYLTLSSVDSSGEHKKLNAVWHNETTKTVTYGNWFVIEMKDGDNWTDVSTADVSFTEEAYIIKRMISRTQTEV